MNLLENDHVSEGLFRAFEAGYPELQLKVTFRERAGRPLAVWSAAVRTREGDHLVATGVRRNKALAVGAALEGIPEWMRCRHRI